MTLKPNEVNALEAELGTAYLWSPKRAGRILASLAAGNYRETAARVAGLSKTTFYEWLDRSPTFREMVERAESDAEEAFAASVKRAGTPHVVRKRTVRTLPGGGVEVTEVLTREYDWQAAAWLLARRFGKRWREQKQIDVKDLTDEQIIALLDEGESGAEGASEGGGDTAGPAGSGGG